MNCKRYCKWLGYDYITDEYGHIIGITDYKCEKFKENLTNPPERCDQCLTEDSTKQWDKNKFKNRR